MKATCPITASTAAVTTMNSSTDQLVYKPSESRKIALRRERAAVVGIAMLPVCRFCA
ncbi:hypothetical protein GCM10007863_36750 [Dyella mobilis]|nr:hypothetical protein GCM10007863_36750 [Dyella mobilis]